MRSTWPFRSAIARPVPGSMTKSRSVSAIAISRISRMTRGIVAQCSADEALDIGRCSPGYRPLDELDLLLVELERDFVARLSGHLLPLQVQDCTQATSHAGQWLFQ